MAFKNGARPSKIGQKLGLKTKSELRIFGKPFGARSPQASPHRIGWFAAFGPRYLLRPSAVILIAANLLPLAGVVFWGWDLFTLLVLYWAETGIIGLFAIVQMAIGAWLFALFLVPFFVVHFGGFMLAHFVFLSVFFGSGPVSNRLEDIPQVIAAVMDNRGLWLALAALLASHGVSFVLNILLPLFARGREALPPAGDNRTAPMFGVYGRVIVMHLTILIGAMLSEFFGSRTAALVLLIALKLAADIPAHVRKNFAPEGQPISRLS